MFDVLKEL